MIYNTYMKKNIEPKKALLFHFPVSLVMKIEKSAEHNQRSVVKEVTWRLLQSFDVENESKITVDK